MGMDMRELLRRAVEWEDARGLVGEEGVARAQGWLGEARLALAGPSANLAVAIVHPEAGPEMVVQGDVQAFVVDMGGVFDISEPEALDAEGALQMAAAWAKDAASLPEGPVRETLEDAVSQAVEAFGDYGEAVEALDEEDKALLEPWLGLEAAPGKA